MPLNFDTLSHGQIPIGFFNIDTDLFLINNYFIFADDLCLAIGNWAVSEVGNTDIEQYTKELELYVINNPEDVGNLMGAIYGVIYTGFIGEVYKKFPFPEKKENFKQKPNGFRNREVVKKILLEFGEKKRVEVKLDKKAGTLLLGEFKFDQEQFHEVIAYIWRGGMPGWKDDQQPEYVKTMMRTVLESNHWFFMAAEQ
jgi:hypothetical protein